MEWVVSIVVGIQVGFDFFIWIVLKDLAKSVFEMSKIITKLSLRKEK